MDEQYETVIGERGVGLSGGQKQRISIARALSKHSPILVMDDSTSALDMETEHEIQKTLNSLKDTTKIIIAHRISAVCHADEIIYLQDGRIAEHDPGDGKELALSCGNSFRIASKNRIVSLRQRTDKKSALAAFAAAIISSLEASGFP